jgi:hypothetical protein
LALSTAKSGAKLHQIRRKLGVGSAEFPAGTPGRRSEIGIFGLLLQINVTVWLIFTNKRYSLANFWLIFTNKRYSLAQINVTVRQIL